MHAAEYASIPEQRVNGMQALSSQPSNGNDEVEEVGVMDAAYALDEVDALEDGTDAMEEPSSVVSRDTSGHVASTCGQAMQAKQQLAYMLFCCAFLSWPALP